MSEDDARGLDEGGNGASGCEEAEERRRTQQMLQDWRVTSLYAMRFPGVEWARELGRVVQWPWWMAVSRVDGPRLDRLEQASKRRPARHCRPS